MQNRTEKQIMRSKTTINWLFNDILCYLFIACFDWKIGFFQQTVVKVCLILYDVLGLKGLKGLKADVVGLSQMLTALRREEPIH